MMMDHTCIDSFCRLCGDERTDLQIPKSKLEKDILSALKVNIKEDGDRFPSFICSSCTRKVQRWRKKKNSHKTKTDPTITVCTNFEKFCSNCVNSVNSNLESTYNRIREIIAQKCSEMGMFFQISDDRLSFHKLTSTFKCIYVEIFRDLTWGLMLDGSEANSRLSLNIPSVLNNDSVELLVDFIASCKVCSAITGYEDLCRVRSPTGPAVFLDKQSQPIAKEESHGGTSCIRNVNCEKIVGKIVTTKMCTNCALYKSTISSLWTRHKKNQLNPVSATRLVSSHARNDYMTNETLRKQLSEVQKDRKNLKRKNSYLQKKLETEGVDLSSEKTKSFEKVIECNTPPVISDCIEDIKIEMNGDHCSY